MDGPWPSPNHPADQNLSGLARTTRWPVVSPLIELMVVLVIIPAYWAR